MTAQVLQWILIVVYLMAGGMKLMMPKEKLAAKMGWVNDFSGGQVKLIGTVELLSVVGLVVGFFIESLLLLSQLAAVAIVLLMVGATFTHLKRKEMGSAMMTLVLLVLAVWFGLIV